MIRLLTTAVLAAALLGPLQLRAQDLDYIQPPDNLAWMNEGGVAYPSLNTLVNIAKIRAVLRKQARGEGVCLLPREEGMDIGPVFFNPGEGVVGALFQRGDCSELTEEPEFPDCDECDVDPYPFGDAPDPESAIANCEIEDGAPKAELCKFQTVIPCDIQDEERGCWPKDPTRVFYAEEPIIPAYFCEENPDECSVWLQHVPTRVYEDPVEYFSRVACDDYPDLCKPDLEFLANPVLEWDSQSEAERGEIYQMRRAQCRACRNSCSAQRAAAFGACVGANNDHCEGLEIEEKNACTTPIYEECGSEVSGDYGQCQIGCDAYCN